MLAPPKPADDMLAHQLTKGRLALEEALRQDITVAGSLDALHRQGRVHGALRRDHILLTKEGVKLSAGEPRRTM